MLRRGMTIYVTRANTAWLASDDGISRLGGSSSGEPVVGEPVQPTSLAGPRLVC